MSKQRGVTDRRGFLGAAGVCLFAAACSSGAPSALYSLEAAQTGSGAGRARGAQVLVPPPRALKALDTSRIAVVDQGTVYSYFPEAAWADTLPNVVQLKLRQSLQNTGRFAGVGLPGDGLLIDYQLQTELRSFEMRIDGSNRAVVAISARLVNDRNGRAIANRVFEAETPVSGSSADDAVEALNISAQRVFSEIAVWAQKNA